MGKIGAFDGIDVVLEVSNEESAIVRCEFEDKLLKMERGWMRK